VREKDLKVVIPSRKRVESCRVAAALVPFADVCVAEGEKEDYAEFGGRLTTHPDEVTGMAAIRTWILDNYNHDCVVTFDDDVFRLVCMVGHRPRNITDPAAVFRILYNSASIAKDIGAPLFGYAITANILGFFPYDPFAFLKAFGPVLGFVGRRIYPDPQLNHSTDADMALQALLKYRIVWQDTRFCFEHKIMTNSGGNRHFITTEKWAADQKHLKRKWGPYIKEQVSGGVTRTVISDITRHQKLVL
jgi:hypothetical protein